MQLLHEHAPGWLPDAVPADGGGLLHNASVGCFLHIRFVHTDGAVTPAFPQAIMTHGNEPVPRDKITSRDITDTHRRGICMAAAMVFGLASELWAGNMGENPYRPEQPEASAADSKPKESANGSAPTVANLKELIDKLPSGAAATLKSMFMADHFPSFEGGMAAKHLSKAEHRIALKQLIDEYQTPVAPNPCLTTPKNKFTLFANLNKSKQEDSKEDYWARSDGPSSRSLPFTSGLSLKPRRSTTKKVSPASKLQ